ncbi:MAG: hypothetical protein ACPKMZ_06040, partial [Pleomorphochaeta sp.]
EDLGEPEDLDKSNNYNDFNAADDIEKEVIKVDLKEYTAIEENRIFETEVPSIEEIWPPKVLEIIKFVDKEDNPFFDICKDDDSELLEGIDYLINKALEKQKIDNKEKMFTIPGYDLTLVLATNHNDKLKLWERRNNLGAVMFSQNKENWNALVLKYNADNNLIDVEEVEITKDSFDPVDWKFVVSTGNRLKKV